MHSMPDFCGSWRGIKTRVERQTTTSSHVRVRHPWETCSFTSFSASVSTLNQQIFTYFVQRRSFLSSRYHFNLKQAFKVNNLLWLCSTVAVTGRVLFDKSAVEHAHVKKTPVMESNHSLKLSIQENPVIKNIKTLKWNHPFFSFSFESRLYTYSRLFSIK